jgi:hypothetical protein
VEPPELPVAEVERPPLPAAAVELLAAVAAALTPLVTADALPAVPDEVCSVEVLTVVPVFPVAAAGPPVIPLVPVMAELAVLDESVAPSVPVAPDDPLVAPAETDCAEEPAAALEGVPPVAPEAVVVAFAEKHPDPARANPRVATHAAQRDVWGMCRLQERAIP